MQVTINANGKSIKAEITEEQAQELGLIEDKPKTGYERTKIGETYYIVGIKDNAMEVTEYKDQDDAQSYDTGNYYSDRNIAENNARADRLFRQLRQWQALNDRAITKKDWEDRTQLKYCIIYGYGVGELYVDCLYNARWHNMVYFTTDEKAEEAIEVFNDELLWYFTEYVQRLDEVQDEK